MMKEFLELDIWRKLVVILVILISLFCLSFALSFIGFVYCAAKIRYWLAGGICILFFVYMGITQHYFRKQIQEKKYVLPDPDKLKDLLLLEYQKSQDSAEHHDTVSWIFLGIILGGMFILFKFIFDAYKVTDLLLYSVAALGFILTIIESYVGYLFWMIKIQKYKRCKDIEMSLGTMKQHSELEYVKGGQFFVLYTFLIIYVLTWICILYQPRIFGIALQS